MSSENFIEICEEPTTYRDDFRYRPIHRDSKEIRDVKKASDKTRKFPVYAESHDTLQKFNYSNRLPFDALWRFKKNVDTNRRSAFFEDTPNKQRTRVSRTKPIELANPALNLDEVEDPEMRKLVVDFTYKTTTSLKDEEVWRNWKKTEVQLPNTIFEDSANSVSLKMKLIPDLPAGFKGAAKKWDFLQDRGLVNRKNFSRPVGASTNLSRNFDNERGVVGELMIDEKNLSLPYKKLSSSYGGHRTPLALGVNPEKKKISIYHPDLSVSQVLAMRRDQDG